MTLSDQELSSSKHPGQLTATMRAGAGALATRQGPKLLRIGVVHAGRVREELTIATPAHVTVGTREGNTFLLGGATQPTSFRLFERIDDAYHLNFLTEMRGRVALTNGIFELDELKTETHRRAPGAYRIAVSDEARGRVALGDVSILFHFVPPAPILPKAVLPAAVLRGPRRMDWISTIGAGASFLLHFLVLGAIYSDWADPVVDDDVSTAGLIDSLKNLPPPPRIEDKAESEEAPAPTSESPQTKPTNAPPAKRAAGLPAHQPWSGPSGEAALSDQLAKIDVSILGALGTLQPATSGVFNRREVAFGSLDAAAATGAGVGSGSEPRLGSAGAPIQRGNVDLRELGATKRSSEGSGRVASVSGPRAVANLAPLIASAGAVSNAASVVAGMRAGFRACYQHGLDENPDASGAVRLTIRVGPGGEVLSVSASPSGNLPASVVSCVQTRARAAQFDPPEGGSAVIQVPVNFVKQ